MGATGGRAAFLLASHLAEESAPYGDRAPTLRARLRRLPPLDTADLWRAQIEAIRNLERSLAQDRPRSQVQACARALADGEPPAPAQIDAARGELIEAAIAPFDNPDLRELLTTVKRRTEQVIDRVSQDRVIEVGFSAEDTERARQMVDSFREFLEQNRDEIAALQILFNQPYARRRLTFEQIRALAQRIEQPPHAWTTEALWRAYAQLEQDKVRGVGAKRVLTDLVSLVRHAVQLEDELIPYPERVQQRYTQWLAAQQAQGRTFNEEQRWWLNRIAEAIGVNLSVRVEDFQYGELFNRGGWVAARETLGEELPVLLEELNRVLVA